MIAALARPAVAGITRQPRTWVTLGAWFALAATLALVARAGRDARTADAVMLGAYGPILLPFLAYMTTAAVIGPRSLWTKVAPLVAFGATPVRAAAMVVAVGVSASAVSGGALGAITVALARSGADLPLWRDALLSAYAGALGGAAYGAWFLLGATFGRRGGGRPVLLLLDWILGAGSGALAVATPRGHLRNLLGGSPPLGLSERASAVGLLLIAAACTLLALARTRRPRS